MYKGIEIVIRKNCYMIKAVAHINDLKTYFSIFQ